MNKINFVSDQAPGISGPNLNLMQTNAENAIAQAKSEAIGYLDTGSRNSFNPNNITPNYALPGTSDTGGTSSVTDTSDYIKVSANTTYTLTWNYDSLLNGSARGYSILNNNKTFISGGTINQTEKTFRFTPTQNGYIRFSYDKNWNNIQFEKSSVATPYTPFTGKYLNEANYNKVTSIVDKEYLEKGSKNLFDSINANQGYFMKDTGEISVTSDWKYNYINVKPNTQYTIRGVSATNNSIGIAGFNGNRGFVSGVTKYENGTFTTASNIYIIGVSVRVADLNTFQIEEGSTATSYEPYTGKYLNQRDGILRPYVLHNVLSGTTGTVSLNDNIANYSYIEIYYLDNNGINSYAKIPTTENRKFNLIVQYIENNNVYIKTKIVKMASSNITVENYRTINISSTGTVTSSDTDTIKITKVIGYK